MNLGDWKDKASCKHFDTNLFFDKYEENANLRGPIDKLCDECPIQRVCFAVGVSQKEWGVWGGIYLEGGKVSREFNTHRSKKDWGQTWKKLTNDGVKK